MNSRFRRFIVFLLALLVIVPAHPVFANNENPEPENRVGQMSEVVVRARLQQLGYAQPTEIRPQSNVLQRVQVERRLVPVSQYEINTIKDGKSVLLRVDRLSGKVEEIPLKNQ